MRFTIVDLLLVTTLAAVYSAGISYLGRLGGDQSFAVDTVGAIVMIVTMAATTLALGWRSRRSLGGAIVTWKIHNWWMPHAMFVAAFFGYLVFCTWRGGAGSVLLPLILATQQFMFLFNRWIVLGENGAMLALAFVPWDECRMTLDEEARSLRYSHSGRMFPPRFPIKNHAFLVPGEQVPAIRGVLAEKQGDEPQIDADQRG